MEAHSNLLFILAASAELSPEEMLREQRSWDRLNGQEGRSHQFPIAAVEPMHGRRLRVGYVSPDLHGHSAVYFIEPLLSAHDHSRFEIFCYDANTASKDATTDRLRTYADHWRVVAGNSDMELARLIHEDGIDILIDLAGHTGGNRLGAFTYRPAPIQATYLGFFAATGLEAMDYWITDEVLHPLDTPELSVEDIYRLPRCSFCYRPSPDAPDISPCPGVDEQVVLGSFSNLSKLSQTVIETWSRILHRLPGGRLLLMAKPLGDLKTRQLLLDRFAKFDIHQDRLLLRQGASIREYMETYASVDIVLDTFPRSGGTTTAEALWMGVPVVTLAGKYYAGRISASKLVAIGLDDLVTFSREEYVDKVLSLAHDYGLRAELRDNLRNRMSRSSLCDGKGLATAMESAYLSMRDRLKSKV